MSAAKMSTTFFTRPRRDISAQMVAAPSAEARSRGQGGIYRSSLETGWPGSSSELEGSRGGPRRRLELEQPWCPTESRAPQCSKPHRGDGGRGRCIGSHQGRRPCFTRWRIDCRRSNSRSSARAAPMLSATSATSLGNKRVKIPSTRASETRVTDGSLRRSSPPVDLESTGGRRPIDPS